MELTIKVPYIDQVVSHVKRHKTEYIIGGIAVITVTIMRGCYPGVLRVPGKSIVGSAALDVHPLAFFSRQDVTSTVNIISVVEREGRGHPGYLVKCLETGEFFRTQGQAARYFGAADKTMSRHILGDLPNVKGLHFERLMENPV